MKSWGVIFCRTRTKASSYQLPQAPCICRYSRILLVQLLRDFNSNCVVCFILPEVAQTPGSAHIPCVRLGELTHPALPCNQHPGPEPEPCQPPRAPRAPAATPPRGDHCQLHFVLHRHQIIPQKPLCLAFWLSVDVCEANPRRGVWCPLLVRLAARSSTCNHGFLHCTAEGHWASSRMWADNAVLNILAPASCWALLAFPLAVYVGEGFPRGARVRPQ